MTRILKTGQSCCSSARVVQFQTPDFPFGGRWGRWVGCGRPFVNVWKWVALSGSSLIWNLCSDDTAVRLGIPRPGAGWRDASSSYSKPHTCRLCPVSLGVSSRPVRNGSDDRLGPRQGDTDRLCWRHGSPAGVLTAYLSASVYRSSRTAQLQLRVSSKPTELGLPGKAAGQPAQLLLVDLGKTFVLENDV